MSTGKLLQVSGWIFGMVLAGIAARGVEPQTTRVGEFGITGPYTYKNLSIYLITGKETLPKDMELLTLDEALKQKVLVVHETGNVNELAVENTSAKAIVFIQSGDIVKGGKQDRVLAVDVVVKPKSGRLPIASFCVEQGRWRGRGSEQTAQFSSAEKRVSGKALRYAMRGKAEQGEVWQKVEEEQDKLSMNLQTDVKDQKSASSYQLTRENKKVEESAKEYMNQLQDLIKKQPQAIGYAFVINGKFSSADVYGSRQLFEKVWPRMLEACAVEAIADYDEKSAAAKPDETWMKSLTDADKIKESRRQKVAKDFSYVTKETADAVHNEAADERGQSYHLSIDAKK